MCRVIRFANSQIYHSQEHGYFLTLLLSDRSPEGEGEGEGGGGDIFHFPLGMFYVCGYNFRPNSTVFLVLHYNTNLAYICTSHFLTIFVCFTSVSFRFSLFCLVPLPSYLFFTFHYSSLCLIFYSLMFCFPPSYSPLFNSSCSFLCLHFHLLKKICSSLFLPPLFAKKLFIPSPSHCKSPDVRYHPPPTPL